MTMPPADPQPGADVGTKEDPGADVGMKEDPGADVGMKEDPGAGVGASPTQAAPAENGAAYHSTVREEPTSVCGMICDMWPLLLCQGLDATLGVCWTVILYSSIRSTINCATDTPDSFDKSSSNWSGSDHCSDRCYVAEQAQFLKGMFGGFEYACKFFFVPILGFLGDIHGRKLMVLTNLTGTGLACMLFAFATFLQYGSACNVCAASPPDDCCIPF